MKKRNSLIELYRFILSINVIKSHAMFVYSGQYFGYGRLSVEFFFILSGYFLIRSIDKFIEYGYFKGLFKFFISKYKSIFGPLVIAMIFNTVHSILSGKSSIDIWIFLWYVQKLMIVSVVCFTLRYFIKDKKVFFLLILAGCIASNIVHIFPEFYERGIVRAYSSITIGMLLSYIPRIKNIKGYWLWPVVIILQFVCLYPSIFWSGKTYEYILDMLLYPALLYFTFHTNVHSKVLNYLGSLSFGIYAFQSIPLCFRNFWTLTNGQCFWIVLATTILYDIIKRLIIKYRNNKRTKTLLNN